MTHCTLRVTIVMRGTWFPPPHEAVQNIHNKVLREKHLDNIVHALTLRDAEAPCGHSRFSSDIQHNLQMDFKWMKPLGSCLPVSPSVYSTFVRVWQHGTTSIHSYGSLSGDMSQWPPLGPPPRFFLDPS